MSATGLRTNEGAPAVHARRPWPLLGALAFGIRAVGDVAEFGWRAVLAAGRSSRYFGEIIRQCGILVTGTALVIIVMVMVIGGECGLLTVYLLRPVGAQGFAGFVTSLCGLREMWPYMFAYVFAAKVGCGLVAEVGTMRITDELDALACMGIDPMRYVVATRLLAVWLTVPLIYLLAIVFGTLGSFLLIIQTFHAVSLGLWFSTHFSSQTLQDNIFSMIKVMSFATLITIVGLYYGYKAREGPVGVGAATARSMVVNLVLIHVVGGALTAVFWGSTPRISFGG
jgi:phospholipid/cholesterol/gamma-HCH transport system permease protein